MKKTYQSKKARQYRAARARNEARRRQGFRDWRRERNRSWQGVADSERKTLTVNRDNPDQTIVIPSKFKLLSEPDRVLGVLHDIETKGRKYGSVVLDMRSVVEFDLPAITSLSAIGYRTYRLYGENRLFGIRWPLDPDANALIKRSGFKNYSEGHEPNDTGSEANMMADRKRNIQPEYAQQLANIVDDYLHPGKRRGQNVLDDVVYTTVYELMKNTSLHASSTDNEESWWVAYSHDSKINQVEIVFIDCGMGIMESLNRKVSAGTIRRFVSGSNAKFLEDVFHGRVPSSTGIPGRGTGLPTLRETCVDEGLINNAVVVTNDVIANLNLDDYSLLDNVFSGTLVYFRVPAQHNGVTR